jgi:hypothetical protein
MGRLHHGQNLARVACGFPQAGHTPTSPAGTFAGDGGDAAGSIGAGSVAAAGGVATGSAMGRLHHGQNLARVACGFPQAGHTPTAIPSPRSQEDPCAANRRQLGAGPDPDPNRVGNPWSAAAAG